MKVAYFCMEYAIDQSLKIYSGGLGFLAGSHLRSLHDLNKDAIGIGILWSYGYYDQVRDSNNQMEIASIRKTPHFLKDTNIKFNINIKGNNVVVKTFLLEPETFGTVPLYLMTTDIEENDYLSRTISHQLYDPNEAARIAQSILLGIGGGKLIEALNIQPNTYHINEAHGLPLAFYLNNKFETVNSESRKLVFTTHTPERAGNPTMDFDLLYEMGYFYKNNQSEAAELSVFSDHRFDATATGLKLSKHVNAVSKLHTEVSRKMWNGYMGAEKIIDITNAQHVDYWQDQTLAKSFSGKDSLLFKTRKHELKQVLFDEVANQCGKLFNPDVLTIVWARRFAGYKRAWLIMKDFDRFLALINNQKTPIQIIWAGKPYPHDQDGIDLFHHIERSIEALPNCAMLTGYELTLSKKLKQGADVWLNTPRFGREASGTSGMSAAMNGTLNLSIMDGWVPEFLVKGQNGFPIEASKHQNQDIQDESDYQELMNILNQEVLPMYYNDQDKWFEMICHASDEVCNNFSSDRMVKEYYEKMY